MLSLRQPTSREERREWWRRQLARQQSGNLSVTEFCRQIGVSLTTFYYWKKRVSEAASYLSRGNSVQHPSRQVTKSTAAAVSNFMPVSILDPGAGTQLEIELANTCIVRLKGAIDPTLLHAAIAAAGQLDGSHQGGN